MGVPRMRTIAEAARLLKEDDPGTAITPNAIRTKVLAGEIPHVRVGSKRLLDYDRMLEMLHNPPMQTDTQLEYGVIRRVACG